jgi:hypothetical protein
MGTHNRKRIVELKERSEYFKSLRRVCTVIVYLQASFVIEYGGKMKRSVLKRTLALVLAMMIAYTSLPVNVVAFATNGADSLDAGSEVVSETPADEAGGTDGSQVAVTNTTDNEGGSTPDGEDTPPDSQAIADSVIALINAIPSEVTLDHAVDVNVARAAYELLTADEKALVNNFDVLTAAELRLEELNQQAQNEVMAQAVIDQINIVSDVENITLTQEADVVAARSAYDALGEEVKALVSNLTVLEAAETKIAELRAEKEKLEADQSSAAFVDALIIALHDVNAMELSHEAEVVAARQAYDALSEDAKLYVNELTVLENAEARIAQLKAEAEAAAAAPMVAEVTVEATPPVAPHTELTRETGKVTVIHYDVSNIIHYPNSGKSEEEWKNTLTHAVADTVFKSGMHGSNNWTIGNNFDAFLTQDTSNTEGNTQQIIGFITPDTAVEKFRISVDDGVRLYIDTNLDGSASEKVLESWKTQGSTQYTSEEVNLIAGESYAFHIDYFNWGGSGDFRFEAKVDGQWKLVPPQWFWNTPNAKPVIDAPDVTISVSELPFDLATGVTVTDAEDGVITSYQIKEIASQEVDGVLNNVVAGDYIIEYTAKDSKNAQTTVQRTITVEDDANKAPVAIDVAINAATPVQTGQKVTGTYTYTDTENDPEGTSLYQWYVLNGDTYERIDNATDINYTIPPSMAGKQLVFEVTPVSEVEPTTGEPVKSAPVSVGINIPQGSADQFFHTMISTSCSNTIRI